MCTHALHIQYRDQWRRRLLSFSSPGSKARPNVALSMGNRSTAFPLRSNGGVIITFHILTIAQLPIGEAFFGHFTHSTSVSVPLPADATGRVFGGSPEKKEVFSLSLYLVSPFFSGGGGEGARITTFKGTEEKKGEECHSARHFGFERAELTGCCSPFFSHRWSFTKSTETRKKKKKKEEGKPSILLFA